MIEIIVLAVAAFIATHIDEAVALVADRRLWRFALGATGFILVLQLCNYIPAAKEMLGV